ncbi:signal peptidase I [Clostridium sp. BJN0001]|uniref:signal peptidase I n=1 Tax=Clostridium sp. BJN0001 TaxID=2930219 RepID=UPI001FD4CD9A|nr:signal peptidase I [Clostridium sp. BJN0001]
MFFKKNSEKNKEQKSTIKEWIIDIFSVVIISVLIWNFVAYSIWIESGSMIPKLNINDRLISTRVYHPQNLEYGDIVVFKSDELNKILIKRLIGKPGDKIDIKDGIVYRNGEKLEEDYVKNNEKYDGTFNVPEGKYFFLGDNRKISDDARYWKNPYIDGSKIEGKAQIKYYPIGDFEIIK